jgi:hypothetical protein
MLVFSCRLIGRLSSQAILQNPMQTSFIIINENVGSYMHSIY